MRWRLALVAAAVGSHAMALAGGFVWLDHGDLEQGAALAPLSGWLGLLTHGFARTGFYRPLTALSLSVDALAGSPLLFHAQSLAWHAAAAVLCATVAEALGLTRRAALLAAFVFALHPATSLVADAISFRGDALVAVGLLGLLAAHASGRVALATLCALLSPLAKESGYVLAPLFILALELSPLPSKNRPRRMLISFEAAALVAALALRFAFAPAWRGQQPPLSAVDAVGTRLASLAKSAFTLAIPIDHTICDAFPVTSLTSPYALAGLVVALALGWIALKRRGPGLLLAASLLQSLNLVAAPNFWSPHYLYLPLAFAAMLAAERIDRLGTRAIAAGAAVAAALGALTFYDGRRFQSDDTLFSYEVAARPECRVAHFYLGEARRAAGDLEGAALQYSRAILTTPGILSYVDEPAALQNLGVVRLQQGRLAEAEQSFRSALELVKDDATRRRLIHDLALCAVALGDLAEVVRLLEPEAARADAMPESLLILAGALHDLGREDEAKALFARAALGAHE